MSDALHSALRATVRAQALLMILDRAHDSGTLYTHLRGVRHELITVRTLLVDLGAVVDTPDDRGATLTLVRNNPHRKDPDR